ncbi:MULTISPECIES: hypothetical protein [Acetobacter]|uniref:Uncharacterized protein n=1 Tax=Acetobacter tropicalis TaxID=104102 RepID=A0A291PDE6_9PROT|nr:MULTISPECIES: hypothetical protein [Acetobacter]ATJ89438.1 hypothetical protein CIW82_00575 [Acetobacter tropicalis]
MTDTPLTGAGLIASAYPARYYAQYDRTATGITQVTALIDTLADTAVINALPAAADMVALTSDQWALAQTARSLHVQGGLLLYPARYYAEYDASAVQPTRVISWTDMWEWSDLGSAPDISNLLAVSPTDWADQSFRRNGKGVQDGQIIDYTPPVPVALQAQMVLSGVPGQTWAKFGSKGKAVPQAWVDYQDALEAIADGTDTTSTTLPAEPAS